MTRTRQLPGRAALRPVLYEQKRTPDSRAHSEVRRTATAVCHRHRASRTGHDCACCHRRRLGNVLGWDMTVATTPLADRNWQLRYRLTAPPLCVQYNRASSPALEDTRSVDVHVSLSRSSAPRPRLALPSAARPSRGPSRRLGLSSRRLTRCPWPTSLCPRPSPPLIICFSSDITAQRATGPLR